MKFKINHILYTLLFLWSIVSYSLNDNDIKLITAQTEFEAGDAIVLKFSTSNADQPLLYCSNSYSSTLIEAHTETNQLHYVFPEQLTKKTGELNWKLLHNNRSITGTITIKPKQDVATIETYIGPPSIEAGEIDYTMLVVIPTDSLDNPMAENTTVDAKHQFLDTETTNKIFTKNSIAYQTISSKKESGRLLVSSECLNTNSKEFTITVFPSIPTNFTVTDQRSHQYADGNQITNFQTSILKDKHGNIVSDGTYVDYFITNQEGHVLRTSGTTVNGVAIAKMIHPEYASNWTIKAYVEGIAESESLTLNYEQVIKEFQVNFSKNNREIKIGPLKSFMNQMIPDGLQVQVLVYQNESLLETITKSSLNGFAHFKLESNTLKNGTYTIKVKTAGLEQTFTSVQLW